MEDLAGLDHRHEPRAVLGGALHRHKQGQQLAAIGSAGVFAQGLTERQVLCLGLRRKLRRVGRHEGEGRVLVATVFRKVEVHAADQVPGRVQQFQETLEIGLRARQGLGQGRRGRFPERAQDILGQVFGAGHHRGGQHQRRKLGRRRGRNVRQRIPTC